MDKTWIVTNNMHDPNNSLKRMLEIIRLLTSSQIANPHSWNLTSLMIGKFPNSMDFEWSNRQYSSRCWHGCCVVYVPCGYRSNFSAVSTKNGLRGQFFNNSLWWFINFLSTMRIKIKRRTRLPKRKTKEKQTTHFASIAESTTHKGAAVLVKGD